MRKIPLTEKIQAAIVEAIAYGCTRHDAAEAAGVSFSTFRLWIRKGKHGDPEYSTLFDKVKRAEATAVNRAVKRIEEAGERVWQASAWFLERKRPQDWSDQRHKINELVKAVEELTKRLNATSPQALEADRPATTSLSDEATQ